MESSELLQRLHTEFKNIRYQFSTFFENHSHELIRFQFGKTPTQFYFRIKFSGTHKSIKFFINKNSRDYFSYQLLEKTSNIVEDIDNLHKVIKEETVSIEDDYIHQKFAEMFVWGIMNTRDRKQEIFRVPANKLSDWTDDEFSSLSKQELYYDIVKNFKVVSDFDNEGFCEVELELTFSSPFYISCKEYYLETIRPGRLLIVNYNRQFNVMSLTTAKHHLTFSPENYREVTALTSSII